MINTYQMIEVTETEIRYFKQLDERQPRLLAGLKAKFLDWQDGVFSCFRNGGSDTGVLVCVGLTVTKKPSKLANRAAKKRTTDGCSRRGAYSVLQILELPFASSDTGRLVAAAGRLAELIFQPGYAYKKAGVMASELTPETFLQHNLFEDAGKERRNERLMAAMDALNGRMGKNTASWRRVRGRGGK